MAKLSVELMVVMFGTLTLWLGLLKIAEAAGLVEALARLLAPLFARLMPGVPRGHPAIGLITMNFAANGIGLDNAATPIGLKAMRELQTLNRPARHRHRRADPVPRAERLVAHAAAGVDLRLPRAAGRGRPDAGVPADPARDQRLDAGRAAVGGVHAAAAAARPGGPRLAGGRRAAARRADGAARGPVGDGAGGLLVAARQPRAVRASSCCSCVAGLVRRVPVYEAFIDGARQGFEVARDILPYLVAMLCAIGAAARLRRARSRAVADPRRGRRCSASTTASSTRCRRRWSSRSPAAPPAPC